MEQKGNYTPTQEELLASQPDKFLKKFKERLEIDPLVEQYGVTEKINNILNQRKWKLK